MPDWQVGDFFLIAWPDHWSDGLLAEITELRSWGVIANIIGAPPGVGYRVRDTGNIPTRIKWEEMKVAFSER